ncbi:hypothetical protein [Planomicrobium okeanokoites]|uniref:hypothetical protein n=1 Tax=Planomicrobium okeanokoites TaxID=244 RepID=UPI0011821E23|nr:hypothetical protein [Planomicrobium okeanokoites]
MEKQAKYNVNKTKKFSSETAKINIAFEKLNRRPAYFLAGDIVITEDNHLQQISMDLEPDKAMELLKSNSLKAFYPIDSKIDLD